MQADQIATETAPTIYHAAQTEHSKRSLQSGMANTTAQSKEESQQHPHTRVRDCGRQVPCRHNTQMPAHPRDMLVEQPAAVGSLLACHPVNIVWQDEIEIAYSRACALTTCGLWLLSSSHRLVLRRGSWWGLSFALGWLLGLDCCLFALVLAGCLATWGRSRLGRRRYRGRGCQQCAPASTRVSGDYLRQRTALTQGHKLGNRQMVLQV